MTSASDSPLSAASHDQLDPLDDAAAADDEHLHHRAPGADLHTEHVAIAQLRRRHLLLPLANGFDGAHRVTQLRGLFEPLAGRRIEHARRAIVRPAPGCVPPETACVSATATEYRSALQIVATHGARHRLMSYSRQGRCRVPVMTSLHDRMPNTLWVSDMVRRANFAGRNGPAYMLPSRSTERATSTRGNGLGRRQLQVWIVLVVAQQDVVARRPLLDEIVLERQRLNDRVGDDDFKADGFVEQRVVTRAHPVGAQVRARPIAQGPGLADVKRVAVCVVVEIDARLLWQPGNLLFQVLKHGISDFRSSGSRINCRSTIAESRGPRGTRGLPAAGHGPGEPARVAEKRQFGDRNFAPSLP